MALQVALVRKRYPMRMVLFSPELFAVKGALHSATVPITFIRFDDHEATRNPFRQVFL